MSIMNANLAIQATREELIGENNRLENELSRLRGENAEIRQELSWLKRQLFGTKSERFTPDVGQTSLELGVEQTQPECPAVQTISYKRCVSKSDKEKQGHGRGVMPTHLPIDDEIIEPQGKPEGCVHIGDEISWRYEYQRGSLRIKRTIRPKYALPGNSGVLTAELPPAAIDKGNAGASLIAHVMQSKYEYHIPLDRLRKMIDHENDILFAESFMCDIVKHGCFWIEPVYRLHIERLLQSKYLQADETPIPVLCRDVHGKTHRGYFWVYYDPLNKLLVFDYRKSRASEGPKHFLERFRGTLQVDGYEGYNEVLKREDIIWASCMDHVRRYFERALESSRALAGYALETIGSWYAIEAESAKQELDTEQRLKRRQNLIAPSMTQFRQWMTEHVHTTIPKDLLVKAVNYALGQWDGFTPFLTDGNVRLSNCLIENSIRPVAIGRKNYMFKGSHEAAQRGAMIYSIIGTAKLHSIDRFYYLTDLFTRLPAVTNKKIEPFLPNIWKSEK